MLPVEVAPDAEAAVLAYLRQGIAGRTETVLTGLKLGNYIDPATLPYAAVRRIGGTMVAPGWDQPRLAIQVWAKNAADRNDISQILRALLVAAHDKVAGYAVTFADEVLGPSSLPDPADATKQITQFTHELNVRALP